MKRKTVGILCIGVLVLLAVVGTAMAGSISPDSISATLYPGESIEEEKTVATDPTPVPKLDVLFVIDATGSMSDEIDVVKAKATDIMNNISSIVPDSAFGVATFMDYSGIYNCCGYYSRYGGSSDYPWKLDQDITTDTTAVETAIGNIVTGWGGDGPQDYSRALYESQFVSWRDGAKKIVIVFGDAAPHDCDFCSRSTGCDPGRDAVAGTADDLDFQAVVSQLADSDITVIAVDSSSGGCAEKAFKYMANETGGKYFKLSSAEEIPDAIKSMIEEEISLVTLTLGVDSGFEDWVSYEPSEYFDVGGCESKDFTVNITVPNDVSPGCYEFYIYALADGATIAKQKVKICVPQCVPEFPLFALGALGLLAGVMLVLRKK